MVNWPGVVMLITPAQVHIQIESFVSSGISPRVTVAAPGVQGDVVTGMQGCGVSTPRAAAVAAATWGLAGEMHMPKGMIFSMGTKSIILAAFILPHVTRFIGVTCNTDGATPMVHINWAVITVTCGIVLSPRWQVFVSEGREVNAVSLAAAVLNASESRSRPGTVSLECNS